MQCTQTDARSPLALRDQGGRVILSTRVVSLHPHNRNEGRKNAICDPKWSLLVSPAASLLVTPSSNTSCKSTCEFSTRAHRGFEGQPRTSHDATCNEGCSIEPLSRTYVIRAVHHREARGAQRQPRAL
eukprot:7037654-Prymnesium_polylepis.1